MATNASHHHARVAALQGRAQEKPMKILGTLAGIALLGGCGTTSYKPAYETGFDRLASEGCTRSEKRFSVTAQVNSATRENIVLWDGSDNSRTVAVQLPKQGAGTKVRGWFGKNRYEVSYDRLNELRESGTPITLSLHCDEARMAPIADRYSYSDGGEKVEFEF
jgi:hypothetical protein